MRKKNIKPDPTTEDLNLNSDPLSKLPVSESPEITEDINLSSDPLIRYPVAEYPDPENFSSFYMREILSWLEYIKNPSPEIQYANEDYEIKYSTYPPEPDIEKDLQPIKTNLNPFSKDDLFNNENIQEWTPDKPGKAGQIDHPAPV